MSKRNGRGLKTLAATALCLAATAMALAQHRTARMEDTLAVVGTRPITTRDLVNRIELMPWPGKERPGDADTMKIHALQSLVAEQILALEAIDRGFADDAAIRAQRRTVEKLLVRDELYRREVKARVPEVTQGEIREGLKRYAWKVSFLMLNARTRSHAEKVSATLRAGGKLDSVLRTFPVDDRRMTVDTATVTFGMLERTQEAAVYALVPERPVSEPVEVPRLGWVVLSLLSRQANPEVSRQSTSERARTVEEKIRRRKEAAQAAAVAASVLSDARAETRRETFELLAEALHAVFSGDTARLQTPAGYRLDLAADSAGALLARHINDPLVDLGGEVMTLRDVLDGWKYFDFALPTLQENDFRLRVNAAVREMVTREYLAREGFRRGLHRADDVRRDVDAWTTSWLAASMRQSLAGDVSVTEEEILDFLIGHPQLGEHYEVNIREVLSDSLTQALALMERHLQGEEMAVLARAHSRRPGWAAHGGESGFFRVSRLPEIGFRALRDSIGAVDGPVATAGGYSFFAVLGKRSVRRTAAISVDSLWAAARQELLSEKRQGRIDRHLAAVAKNYDVTLSYDRLKTVDVFPHNMVTRRFIGFGGTMLAVPSLTPAWRWVEEAEGIKEVLP